MYTYIILLIFMTQNIITMGGKRDRNNKHYNKNDINACIYTYINVHTVNGKDGNSGKNNILLESFVRQRRCRVLQRYRYITVYVM